MFSPGSCYVEANMNKIAIVDQYLALGGVAVTHKT